MRRLLVASLALNAITLALLVSPAPVDGEGGRARRNGDVNADGAIDIADAIHLLDWLFVGGPAPAPIDCPTLLPATGQSRCFDDAGAVISCDDDEFPGQDGFWRRGCPSGGRFAANGDGTVTDTCTGLVWEQRLGRSSAMTWKEALRYCADLELGGHDDWRLPNVRELQSLADYGRHSPAFDSVFDPVLTRYWSSTTDVHDPLHAWVMNGLFGNIADIVPKDFAGGFPRAVRGP